MISKRQVVSKLFSGNRQKLPGCFIQHACGNILQRRLDRPARQVVNFVHEPLQAGGEGHVSFKDVSLFRDDSLSFRRVPAVLKLIPYLTQALRDQIGGRSDRSLRVILQCPVEMRIGAVEDCQVRAESFSELNRKPLIVGGILDAGELDREGILQAGEQIQRKADSGHAGEVIPEQESIARDRLVDQFAEPFKQPVIACLAVIIGRQNDYSIVSKIESQFGQLDRFRQTGCAGSGEKAKARQLLTKGARRSQHGFALAGGKGGTLTGGAEEQGAVASMGGQKSQERWKLFEIDAEIGFEWCHRSGVYTRERVQFWHDCQSSFSSMYWRAASSGGSNG